MRLTDTFEIERDEKDPLKVEVKELTVREIIDLSKDPLLENLSIEALKEIFGTKLLPLCTNITIEDMIEMAPSEIMTCWKKFEEVNAVFFDVARKAGIGDTLQKLKKAVIEDFSSFVADSSKLDT